MHLQAELRMHFFDNMEELWYTKGKNAKAAPLQLTVWSAFLLLRFQIITKKENDNEVNGSGQI